MKEYENLVEHGIAPKREQSPRERLALKRLADKLEELGADIGSAPTLPPAEHAAIEVELLMHEPAVACEVWRQLDMALHPVDDNDGSPELDPIFAQLQSDAWDRALDGIDTEKARAIIVQLFARLPETERGTLVRELDDIEHPWGGPGDVPEEPGLYWVHVPETADDVEPGEVRLMWRDAAVEWWHGYAVGGHEWIKKLARRRSWRFRKRWTPEAP